MRNLALLLLCLGMALSSWAQASSAYLGIQSENISKEKAKALGFNHYHGSYITKVVPNSPAAAAGLKPFDYIFAVDKFTLSADRKLSKVLSAYRPGDQAVIYYVRKGKTRKAKVTLGTPMGAPVISNNKKPFLGVSPHPTNDKPNHESIGVVIKPLANSTAAEIGLQDGDRITAINGYTMVDWNDISIVLGMLQAGDPITVEYLRNYKRQTAKGTLKAYSGAHVIAEFTWTNKAKERALLGISSNTLRAEKAAALGFDNPYGSYVTEIIPGTSAEEAGLQPFDYVYGIDDWRTSATENLTALLQKYKAGDRANIHFIRQGKPMSAEVIFMARKPIPQLSKPRCEQPFLGVSASSTHSEGHAKGLPVDVIPNSTAEAMGLKNGDIILLIDQYPILDWSDVSTAINRKKTGDTISVLYRRGNTHVEASQPIKSVCDIKGRDASVTIKLNFPENFPLGKPGAAPPQDEDYQPIQLHSVNVSVKALNADEANDLKNRRSVAISTQNDLNLEDLQLIASPATGLFRLQFRLPESGVTIVRLYNATGRLIYAYEPGVFSGDFSDDVDISQNGAGHYYLEVRQGERSAAWKVTLQN